MNNRKLLAIPFSAIAIGLTIASAAYACTYAITGTTTVTSINGTSVQCDGQGSNDGTYDNYVLNDSSTPDNDCTVAAGDTITANASGAPTNYGYYNLFFLNEEANHDNMNTCMGKPTSEVGDDNGYYDDRINVTTATQSGGNISSTTGTIPSTAVATNGTTGPALICFMSADSSGTTNYNAGTNPAELTVM